MRVNIRLLLRRLEAGILAVGTLWVVAVTAGSATAKEAAQSLRAALPTAPLRWQLGALPPQDGLSPAAVTALAQSPLLLSARDDIAALRATAAETPPPAFTPLEQPSDNTEDAEPVTVPAEPSTPAEIPAGGVDNGVEARTLTPSDPSGYTVCGQVYIKNSTEHTLTAEALQQPFAAELGDDAGPQILILHTHGSEAYTPVDKASVVWSGDHRTTDSRWNVVRMGDVMAETFGRAGIAVLHDRTLYDYPNYAGAYDRSLAAIEGYLAKYPSIRFVLDVHRDAVEDGEGNQFKVISPTDAGTSAQLTLVVGSDGSGAAHPDWMENLRLATAIQQAALEDSPTLMRPLLLRNSRYNQHATTGSLLVEVGAAGNAPEEAALAARLFAEKMTAVLKGQP